MMKAPLAVPTSNPDSIGVPALAILLAMTLTASAQTIVAHRGASHDAPENTLAAFRLAWEKGADAVEGDFLLSRDGQIVCIHDKTAKRTGGRELKVVESTLEELRELEYGAWKAAKYKGEPIPTLAEALAVVPAGKRIFIEIKCGPEIVPTLKKEIAASGLKRGQIVIIAFDAEVIAAAKRAMPGVKACWLTSFKQDKASGDWTPSVDAIVETLKRIKADGLDCRADARVVDEAFVKRLRAESMELHCWTVNDPEVARRFRALGFDSITTDRPAFLRRALAAD